MSEEFKRFAREWDFEHVTSSPHHQNANGKAEAAVKMAKRTMRKCKEGNGDIYKAFLELRNTPSQGVESSPAQRLLGRRTRAFIPTTANLLRPRGSEIMTREKQRMERIQMKQAFYYNKTAKDLPVLHEGDTVRMKPFQLGKKKWGKAVVNRRLDERSYEVETNSGTYRRNRIHLRKSNETPPGIRQRPDQASDDRTTRRDDPKARRDDPTTRHDDRMARRDDRMARHDDRMARRDDRTARRDDPTTRRDDRMARRDDRMARHDDPLARRDDPTSRDEVNESEAMNEPTLPARVSQRNDEPEMGNVRTRSGRAVKAPERFNDYVSS